MSNARKNDAGWKQRLRRELFEYWVTVVYLALYFGAFTLYRRLILAQHEIEYLNYGIAVVQALVLGKVVLIGNLIRRGRGMESRPLIGGTLVSAALFTVWVATFKLAEHTIGGLLRGEGLAAGFYHLVGKGSHELLASSLVVFFTFIPFFAFQELNRVLGKGKIWSLFFRGRENTAAGLGNAAERGPR